MISSLMNSTLIAGVMSAAVLNVPGNPSPRVAKPGLILIAETSVDAVPSEPFRIDIPKLSSGGSDLLSGQTDAPGRLEGVISGLHQELLEGEQNIQRLIESIGNLADTTIEDAYAAAEEAIGIGKRIDRLLEDGGEIDEAIRDAKAYFQGVGEYIARNEKLSDSQRNELLDIINGHQGDLAIEANRLLEMRRTVRTLTAKAEQSREYLAMAHLAMVGGEIVEKIQHLTETLSAMAATLRELTRNADVAAFQESALR